MNAYLAEKYVAMPVEVSAGSYCYVIVNTILEEGEYVQFAFYDTYRYARFVFVKPQSELEGKTKATYTIIDDTSQYTHEYNYYYDSMITNGVEYTPAEGCVIFAVTVKSGSRNLKEAYAKGKLACELALE